MSWIDSFVAEIDALLAEYDREAAADLISRMRRKFIDEDVKIRFGMESHRMMISAGDAPRFVPTDDDYIHDLKGFRARLLEVKADRLDPLSVHYQPTMSVSVNVDVANYVSIVQSFPESTLSDEEKDVLAGMLATFQNSEGEKKDSKLMDIVKWLGDKAADVAIQVIPILAGMMQ